MAGNTRPDAEHLEQDEEDIGFQLSGVLPSCVSLSNLCLAPKGSLLILLKELF